MSDPITIAVDAMGGENAPHAEVEGAVKAARDLGVRILLAGREEVLRPELERYKRVSQLPIEIVHASEVITMEDSAAKALRTKRDSSIRVAAREVREGRAQGVVSAGNTGAVMATAKTVLGVVPGVYRPALATLFPTTAGTWAVLVDVGANVDCTPAMLPQFALMGQIYAKTICGYSDPRVGILSIGEEEHKGNDLTRTATPLLKDLPIRFIGNVEGRDLYTGIADVVVCDGFTGNVALKVSEGAVLAIRSILRKGFTKSLRGRLGYLLARDVIRDFRRQLDYSEYGGAPLLGLRGVCLICHGRSNAVAIKNAIRVSAELAAGNLAPRIEKSLDATLTAAAPRG